MQHEKRARWWSLTTQLFFLLAVTEETTSQSLPHRVLRVWPRVLCGTHFTQRTRGSDPQRCCRMLFFFGICFVCCFNPVDSLCFVHLYRCVLGNYVFRCTATISSEMTLFSAPLPPRPVSHIWVASQGVGCVRHICSSGRSEVSSWYGAQRPGQRYFSYQVIVDSLLWHMAAGQTNYRCVPLINIIELGKAQMLWHQT